MSIQTPPPHKNKVNSYMNGGGGTVRLPLSAVVFFPFPKKSKDCPYLKILMFLQLFVADAPMEKNNVSFTTSQRTLVLVVGVNFDLKTKDAAKDPVFLRRRQWSRQRVRQEQMVRKTAPF